MNHDRQMFRRLVETAQPVQGAHLDILHRETRRRAGPGVVPAVVLLGMTVLLVVATIVALSAARNFPPDNQVAQTDATSGLPPTNTATVRPTSIPTGEPTATAARRQATPSIVPSEGRIASPGPARVARLLDGGAHPGQARRAGRVPEDRRWPRHLAARLLPRYIRRRGACPEWGGARGRALSGTVPDFGAGGRGYPNCHGDEVAGICDASDPATQSHPTLALVLQGSSARTS